MPFSYLGSKSRVIDHYPPPTTCHIVEPFAGSARYAMRYGVRSDNGDSRYRNLEVWINDRYRLIYDIWRWIQCATRRDVLNLPDMTERGDDLRNYKNLSSIERKMLGFVVNQANVTPCHKVSGFASNQSSNGEMYRSDGTPAGILFKRRLLKLIDGRIRHWRITCLDYSKCVVRGNPATYFIDAPYQTRKVDYFVRNGGRISDNRFFRELRNHVVKLKNGTNQGQSNQIVVCEGDKADWLPFKPLVAQCAAKSNRSYQELVYTNCDYYDSLEQKLDRFKPFVYKGKSCR